MNGSHEGDRQPLPTTFVFPQPFVTCSRENVQILLHVADPICRLPPEATPVELRLLRRPCGAEGRGLGRFAPKDPHLAGENSTTRI